MPYDTIIELIMLTVTRTRTTTTTRTATTTTTSVLEKMPVLTSSQQVKF
jgi:hypothetical protein